MVRLTLKEKQIENRLAAWLDGKRWGPRDKTFSFNQHDYDLYFRDRCRDIGGLDLHTLDIARVAFPERRQRIGLFKYLEERLLNRVDYDVLYIESIQDKDWMRSLLSYGWKISPISPDSCFKFTLKFSKKPTPFVRLNKTQAMHFSEFLDFAHLPDFIQHYISAGLIEDYPGG